MKVISYDTKSNSNPLSVYNRAVARFFKLEGGGGALS